MKALLQSFLLSQYSPALKSHFSVNVCNSPHECWWHFVSSFYLKRKKLSNIMQFCRVEQRKNNLLHQQNFKDLAKKILWNSHHLVTIRTKNVHICRGEVMCYLCAMSTCSQKQQNSSAVFFIYFKRIFILDSKKSKFLNKITS